MIKVFAAIILAALVESIIFEQADIKLPNIVAGAVCFWQVWSILENESSCNNAKWAKVCQKIMIDKTERHFDIDLSDLKDPEDRKRGHNRHQEHRDPNIPDFDDYGES